MYLGVNITLAVAKVICGMRKCWNWQTGMTKDHVHQVSEGSSPFFRTIYCLRPTKFLVGFLLPKTKLRLLFVLPLELVHYTCCMVKDIS